MKFLSKEFRARIYDVGQLHTVSGLPVLGVISTVVTSKTRSTKRIGSWKFRFAACILTVIYVGGIAAATVFTKAAS